MRIDQEPLKYLTQIGFVKDSSMHVIGAQLAKDQSQSLKNVQYEIGQQLTNWTAL